MSNPAWHAYNPQWLIDLAKQQKPDLSWLHEALEKCTSCEGDPDNLAYDALYFVDRMDGKFKTNVILFSPEHGKIVLDILEDGRVGSISTTPASVIK